MAASPSIVGWLRTAARVAGHPRGTRDALRRFQSEQLRCLVRHAWDEVPFYRSAFRRAGVRPEDVQGIEDLASLPIVGKEDLRRVAVADTLERGVDPETLVVRRTSGSTGRPFSIRRTLAEDRLLYLFRVRAQRQYGVRWRDYTVSVAEPPIGGHQRRGLARLRHAAGFLRRDIVSCFQSPEEILCELDALSPEIIGGYAGALARIAPRIRSGGFRRIRPRIVRTGGEPLLPHLRRTIADGFGAAVYDTYGAHEFDLVAWECPRAGLLHVCDDNLVLEVLRDGQPVAEGERGEVVATGLHCFTMPFIRYRMGDVVTRGPDSCPCGQPFSTLFDVQGRTVDYFQLAGRGEVHPFEITGRILSGDASWIDQHQMAQLSEDCVVLRIAPLGTAPSGAVQRLETIGRDVVGAAVDFRVELIDRFPPDPTGKFRPYLGLGDSGSRER